MKSIDLSIIIPCFNAEKYISRSLDSIVKIPFLGYNIEVIIVDDGSTDSSFDIITDYRNNYNCVKILHQKNKGVSDAINAGLEIFKGEYVFVLAADDWCNFETILEALEIAKTKKLSLCAFGMDYFNENLEMIGSKMKQPIKYNSVFSGVDILISGYQPSSICVFLMHSYYFKKLDFRFISSITQNDVEISNRLMLKAKRVLYTNLVGYNYFRHSESITLTIKPERREKYLKDSIVVADTVRSNIYNYNLKDYKVKKAITINYNNIVWNIIWRFLSKPKELNADFKIECLQELKDINLYPIKGPLKTKFQKFTRIFFNLEFLLKWMLKA